MPYKESGVKKGGNFGLVQQPFPLITRMAQQKWPVPSALARVGRSPFNVGNIVPGVFTPVLAKHSESLPKGMN